MSVVLMGEACANAGFSSSSRNDRKASAPPNEIPSARFMIFICASNSPPHTGGFTANPNEVLPMP